MAENCVHLIENTNHLLQGSCSEVLTHHSCNILHCLAHHLAHRLTLVFRRGPTYTDHHPCREYTVII